MRNDKCRYRYSELPQGPDCEIFFAVWLRILHSLSLYDIFGIFVRQSSHLVALGLSCEPLGHPLRIVQGNRRQDGLQLQLHKRLSRECQAYRILDLVVIQEFRILSLLIVGFSGEILLTQCLCALNIPKRSLLSFLVKSVGCDYQGISSRIPKGENSERQTSIFYTKLPNICTLEFFEDLSVHFTRSNSSEDDIEFSRGGWGNCGEKTGDLIGDENLDLSFVLWHCCIINTAKLQKFLYL